MTRLSKQGQFWCQRCKRSGRQDCTACKCPSCERGYMCNLCKGTGTERCPRCDGKGRIERAFLFIRRRHICDFCNGAGQRKCDHPLVKVRCTNCSGTGRRPEVCTRCWGKIRNAEPCRECDGRGWVRTGWFESICRLPFEEIEALLSLVKADWESIEEVRNRVEHQNAVLARSHLQATEKGDKWLNDSAKDEWTKLRQSSAYVQFGGPKDFDEFVKLRAPRAPRYECYDSQRRLLLEEELACLEQALRVRSGNCQARTEIAQAELESKKHGLGECEQVILNVTRGRPEEALSREEQEEVRLIREFYASRNKQS
jgi:hypothetical protein